MADLIVNNKDAFTEWGVRMGDGFLDAIDAPLPLKEFIENKSRLEHGKWIMAANPKLDERDLTLTFTIHGSSLVDYRAKKIAFQNELHKGVMNIQIPTISDEVYHLIYTGKSVSYGMNMARTFGKITAKFNEPNPSPEGRI
jgi:hypothetical protein